MSETKFIASRLEGLDGIRAFTTLAVTYAHLWLFDIGWIGMHTFFVLSGFLITRVLLHDRDHASGLGDYLKRFYVRRALRVFPIYFAYLLVLLLVGLSLLPEQGWNELSEHILFASLYVYNYFYLTADSQHNFYVSHLWSMAVEEQFYLLWPWAIYFLRRHYALRAFLIAAVVAGPVIRLATAKLWPTMVDEWGLDRGAARAILLLTPCYIDAFAIGALINFVRVRPSTLLLASCVILALIGGMWLNGIGIYTAAQTPAYLSLGWPEYMPRHQQFVWGYSVVNLLLFMFISNVVHMDGGLRRFLKKPALEYFGIRSYSIYIVQYPLLGLSLPILKSLESQFDSRAVMLLMFSLVFIPINVLVAHCTYRYIELPAIKLKKYF